MSSLPTRMIFGKASTNLMKILHLSSNQPGTFSASYRRTMCTIATTIQKMKDTPSSSDEDDDGYSADDSDEAVILHPAVPPVSPLADGWKHLSEANDSNNDFIIKMDQDAVKIRVEIPGVDKQNLKVWFDSKALNFEGVKNDEEFDIEAFCGGEVEMPAGLLQLLKVDETKANVKDGVLKVVIPKLKLEERSDVVVVNVA